VAHFHRRTREMVDHFLFLASVGLGYQLENGANSMKAAADCRAEISGAGPLPVRRAQD
jgi:hypothetical protein